MSIEDFRNYARSHGLEPPENITPGRWARGPGEGKRPSNRAAAYLMFPDGEGGVIWDYSTGLREVWQAKRSATYTRAEREAFARQVKLAKEYAAADLRARQANAANRAVAIWEAAKPVLSNFPYLTRKCIQPYNARIHAGTLALPIVDFSATLTSLQFIDRDGNKRMLSGGRKRGCFIPVSGDQASPSRVVVCEGWATGCTLAEDEPNSLILAAIDAGNLEPVAVGARKRWPDADLVIAGDDDRQTEGNPGRTKAIAAAKASGALLAFPEWPKDAPDYLTDFNDLACYLSGTLEAKGVA